MVSHYPQDGHPPSHGLSLTIQNLPELYYKIGIWQLDLTNKIKTRKQQNSIQKKQTNRNITYAKLNARERLFVHFETDSL